MPNYADIIALVNTLSTKRDPFSHHAPRVATMTSDLATLMHLTKYEIEMVEVGAQLHDIGKLVQRSDVINIPRRLTPAEYDTVKLHPRQGYEIVNALQYDTIVQDVVLHHHENWDGTGYPEKLRGEAISIYARIVHIADVFDAMISPRPYRKGLAYGNVRTQMELQGGAMFDEKLLNLFFRQVMPE